MRTQQSQRRDCRLHPKVGELASYLGLRCGTRGVHRATVAASPLFPGHRAPGKLPDESNGSALAAKKAEKGLDAHGRQRTLRLISHLRSRETKGVETKNRPSESRNRPFEIQSETGTNSERWLGV